MKTIPARTVKKNRFPVAKKEREQSGSTINVRFGSVTVELVPPSPAEVDRNIEASWKALSNAKAALLTPGVSIPAKKDVPLYSANPNDPNILLRRLNGKSERVVLKNGAFEVCR